MYFADISQVRVRDNGFWKALFGAYHNKIFGPIQYDLCRMRCYPTGQAFPLRRTSGRSIDRMGLSSYP
jgi:hypothetical protein